MLVAAAGAHQDDFADLSRQSGAEPGPDLALQKLFHPSLAGAEFSLGRRLAVRKIVHQSHRAQGKATGKGLLGAAARISSVLPPPTSSNNKGWSAVLGRWSRLENRNRLPSRRK